MCWLLTLVSVAEAAEPVGSIAGTVVVPANARNETFAFIDGEGPLPDQPQTVEMSQLGTTFVPPVLVIPRGTTVSFLNRGPEQHNVHWAEQGGGNLGTYPMGETRYELFDVVDIYQIGCYRHSAMSAVIRVVPNKWEVPVARDGTFVLTDIPPGTWRVVVWSPYQNATVARDVEVHAGRTTQISISGGLETTSGYFVSHASSG